MHTLSSQYPEVGDGHDQDVVVMAAWRALAAFGAELDTLTASRLLTMWRHYGKLTPTEVAAVVRRFPRPLVPHVPDHVGGPGDRRPAMRSDVRSSRYS